MANLLRCLCDWRPESGLRWAGGRLTAARLRSLQGLPCRVKTGGTSMGERVAVTCQGQPMPMTTPDGGIAFATTAGGEYALTPKS